MNDDDDDSEWDNQCAQAHFNIKAAWKLKNF